jgi:hypothetical protein
VIWLKVVAVWLGGASLLAFALAQLTYGAMERREARRGR